MYTSGLAYVLAHINEYASILEYKILRSGVGGHLLCFGNNIRNKEWAKFKGSVYQVYLINTLRA